MKNGRHDDTIPESFAAIAEGMSPKELEELLKKPQKTVENIDSIAHALADILSIEELDELCTWIRRILEEEEKKQCIEMIVEKANKLSLSEVKDLYNSIAT